MTLSRCLPTSGLFQGAPRWAGNASPPMMAPMTSQHSERSDAPPRLLRRRNSDRVLGGVAGGLGDYFNVDPLLIRIGFVGLMIFGGAGLVLYVVAWLLTPAEGQEASSVAAFPRPAHSRAAGM